MNSRPESLEAFVEAGETGAHFLVLSGLGADLAIEDGDLFGEADDDGVELHVVVEKAGAVEAVALHFSGDFLATTGEFVDLGFETLLGVALGAATLIKRRQFDANVGVVFGSLLDGLAKEVELAAADFEFRFLLAAGDFLGFEEGLALVLLGGGAFEVAVEAFEFLAGDVEALVGARVLFAELAHFVVEGEGFALLFLLLLAEDFLLLGEGGDLEFELFDLGGGAFKLALALGDEAGEFAEFAFEGQGAGTGFAAAGDGVAVVADAVWKEELNVRVLEGESLGGGSILYEIATGQTGQKFCGSLGEPVG